MQFLSALDRQAAALITPELGQAGNIQPAYGTPLWLLPSSTACSPFDIAFSRPVSAAGSEYAVPTSLLQSLRVRAPFEDLARWLERIRSRRR